VSTASSPRVEAVIDLGAVRANIARLRDVAQGSQLMAVVKADGYGHGMQPVARAAREAGADWIGVAVLEEALALRAAGDTGRLLCWLATPGESYAEAVRNDIDVTASSRWQLGEVVAAARSAGVRARLQLKVDTGLSRNGCLPSDWPDLAAAAAAAQRDGDITVTGVWSHLACADEPEHPANDSQQQVFDEALGVAAYSGLEPEVRHLANSPATLTRPGAHYDLVRTGLAVYGLSPAPGVAGAAGFGLRPALTLTARLAAVKRVPEGMGVSYGHTFVTERTTTLGLVPLGYGDGVPRAAANRAQVLVHGRRARVVGSICMDQFVVDLGTADDVATGEEVVLIGAGEAGEPTAQDWAEWTGTIAYEVVTRLGGRIVRRYTGGRT
jgi:alanine racemase